MCVCVYVCTCVYMCVPACDSERKYVGSLTVCVQQLNTLQNKFILCSYLFR